MLYQVLLSGESMLGRLLVPVALSSALLVFGPSASEPPTSNTTDISTPPEISAPAAATGPSRASTVVQLPTPTSPSLFDVTANPALTAELEDELQDDRLAALDLELLQSEPNY